jgi:hypothetical protein
MTHRDRAGAGGVARGSRCPASPRHALLAENLGKPSLWVIISAPWYKLRHPTLGYGSMISNVAVFPESW